MGKGKGKGKGDWEKSAEAGQACIMLTVFIISLIVYATTPDPTPILKNETIVVGINESYTLSSSCSHIIFLHDGSDRNEVQECGGYYTVMEDGVSHVEDPENWNSQLKDGVRHPDMCRKKCGVCNPEYDDCVGQKYCPVLCETGALCDYTKGAIQPMHCEDVVCGKDNTCIKLDPITCSVHEHSFHQFMTAAYGGLVVVGLFIFFVSKFAPCSACISDAASFYVFYMVVPGTVLTLLSYMCLAICNSGSTMAETRFILMLCILLCPLVFVWIVVIGSSGRQLPNCTCCFPKSMCDACVKAPGSAHSLALFGLFFFLVCDVTLASTNAKQALYWAADVSIPWMEHIAANKRCSNTETLFYVFWTTISGFVGFLLVLLLTNNKSRDANHYFGNIYMFFVGLPTCILMLTNLIFLGQCKNVGMTLINEYGITLSVLYCLLFVLQVYLRRMIRADVRNRTIEIKNVLFQAEKDVENGEENASSLNCFEFRIEAKEGAYETSREWYLKRDLHNICKDTPDGGRYVFSLEISSPKTSPKTSSKETSLKETSLKETSTEISAETSLNNNPKNNTVEKPETELIYVGRMMLKAETEEEAKQIFYAVGEEKMVDSLLSCEKVESAEPLKYPYLLMAEKNYIEVIEKGKGVRVKQGPWTGEDEAKEEVLLQDKRRKRQELGQTFKKHQQEDCELLFDTQAKAILFNFVVCILTGWSGYILRKEVTSVK